MCVAGLVAGHQRAHARQDTGCCTSLLALRHAGAAAALSSSRCLPALCSKMVNSWRGRVNTAASAANRHQLEDRLADVIKASCAGLHDALAGWRKCPVGLLRCVRLLRGQAVAHCCDAMHTPCMCQPHPCHQVKAAGGEPRPTVHFNRLLLRFPALHEGFAAARAVFRELAGSDAGELNQPQMRVRACCPQAWRRCSTPAYTFSYMRAGAVHRAGLKGGGPP